MEIKGITVLLYEQTETGVDDFGAPVYSETPVSVENVLAMPTLSDDVLSTLNLTGKKAVYTLGIPKGDTHDWEDKTVEFFGDKFRTFGKPIMGIDENIPLNWNKKVMVEIYE